MIKEVNNMPTIECITSEVEEIMNCGPGYCRPMED